MKILVTGKNNFISKGIQKYLKNFSPVFIGREELDLLDEEKVNQYFANNSFDIVIHTAIVGGKRLDKNTEDIYQKNIKMFENLLKNKNKFTYFFNICSGASMNEGFGVNKCKEEDIYSKNPNSYYGLSKKYIATSCLSNKNFYNFRIFGCFGEDETEERFFKNVFNSIKNKIKFNIHENKYMDFISIYDFVEILNFYIQNIDKNLPADINAVYVQKNKLSEMFFMCCDLTGVSNEVIYDYTHIGSPYTGDGQKLKSLNINLIGLEESLKKYWNYVNKK